MLPFSVGLQPPTYFHVYSLQLQTAKVLEAAGRPAKKQMLQKLTTAIGTTAVIAIQSARILSDRPLLSEDSSTPPTTSYETKCALMVGRLFSAK